MNIAARTYFLCLLVAFTYSPAFGADVRDFGGRAIQFRDSGSAQAIQAPDEPVPAEAHVESTVTTVPGGDNVNTIVGANAFYSIGITGQNSISANVEAGHVWGGHEALSHVTSFSQDGTAFNLANGMTQQENLVDRHATWVGGHIGGRVGGSVPDERQRGIAHDTDLRSGAIANDFVANPIAPFRYTGRFNITGVTFDTPYRNFFGTADVINSSWGGTDPGGSGFYSRLSDALADQNPTTTFVASAGNSGPGPNTVGFPGSAYNGITVGALENNGANVYNSIVFFSSRGPQDFDAPLNSCSSCRAAVDIAAPGTRLKAAYYGGETGGNNTSLPGPAGGPAGDPASFSPPNGTTANGVSGTSFSAPITAGAAALLHSASKTLASFVGNTESRDARVIKAVLMNSAAKVPGWTNAQMNVGGVIQTTQSLDVATGAGALDLSQALVQYVNADTKSVAGTGAGNQGAVGPVGFDFGQASTSSDNVYPISQPLEGGSTMTVTLAWFRDRTETFQTNGLAFDNAQADLDLIIRNTTTNQIIARSMSAVNVVEHLSFVVPADDLYQIEIDYPRNVFGSISAEQYGLAWHAVAVPEPSPAIALGLLMVGLGVVRRLRRCSLT